MKVFNTLQELFIAREEARNVATDNCIPIEVQELTEIYDIFKPMVKRLCTDGAGNLPDGWMTDTRSFMGALGGSVCILESIEELDYLKVDGEYVLQDATVMMAGHLYYAWAKSNEIGGDRCFMRAGLVEAAEGLQEKFTFEVGAK